MKDPKHIENLRWIRVFTPIHIPKYLVEQIRDRDYTVEDFYKYQEGVCVNLGKDGISLNPFNHLYILANDENLTKGFTWFTVDPLSKDICIHIYSIDKEYWMKGKAVSKLADFIKDFRRKGSLNKVYWITNYPRHSQRHGFKISKSVLMEYSEECDGKNHDGWNNARKKCRAVDTRTEAVSERDSWETRDDATDSRRIQPVVATV